MVFSRSVFFSAAWSKGEWHALFSRYLFWFVEQSCKVYGVAKIKSAMVLGAELFDVDGVVVHIVWM